MYGSKNNTDSKDATSEWQILDGISTSQVVGTNDVIASCYTNSFSLYTVAAVKPTVTISAYGEANDITFNEEYSKFTLTPVTIASALTLSGTASLYSISAKIVTNYFSSQDYLTIKCTLEDGVTDNWAPAYSEVTAETESRTCSSGVYIGNTRNANLKATFVISNGILTISGVTTTTTISVDEAQIMFRTIQYVNSEKDPWYGTQYVRDVTFTVSEKYTGYTTTNVAGTDRHAITVVRYNNAPVMTRRTTSWCYDGVLTAATCSASPCDASAAPANGAVGDCRVIAGSTLASGSTCQPTCNAGYTVSGTSSCTLGTLTAATCSASPCDTSAAPANGAVGDCTSTLASGSTCQPTCNAGYTVSGTSSCLAGTFTTAECSVAPSPPPPSPPPPAAAAVQAEMQLTGYSAAEFDDDKKTNFKTGMAKYLGVDSAAITITSVADVTAGRRKLSAVDSVLKVEFTVEATTFSDTTALETKLVVTDVTTMENELNSAGLAVSNIVAPTTITALAPPPSPPPSPPPPASASPLLSVVKLIAATAALAFFAC